MKFEPLMSMTACPYEKVKRERARIFIYDKPPKSRSFDFKVRARFTSKAAFLRIRFDGILVLLFTAFSQIPFLIFQKSLRLSTAYG